MLVRSGAVSRASKILSPAMESLFNCPGETGTIFAMSIVSGGITGAKLTAHYLEEGVLSLQAAKRTLALCSTCSPAFMFGAVAAMLGSANTGWMIALSHYFSVLLCGAIARFLYQEEPVCRLQQHLIPKTNQQPTGRLLSAAVWDAAKSLVIISGLIVFFSVATGVLKSIGFVQLAGKLLSPPLQILGLSKELGEPITAGGLELTTGCKMAAETTATIAQKLIVVTGMISWGGLSVHAQALSFFKRKGIAGAYVFTKGMQAVFGMILCAVLVQVFPLEQTVMQQDGASTGQAPFVPLFFLALGFILLSLLILFCKVVYINKNAPKKRNVL
ncbi:MAG: hypothetical protein ACYCX2_07255 [Christensenellales bacterium]